MDFIESQKDMSTSYVSGATGVLTSGMVWLVASIIGTSISNSAAMIALFVGGIFIFPVSVLLSKLLSASGKHASENSLRHLALETLPVLFGGLIVAFYVAQFKMELFFPVMLLTIGARYFAFHTLYGLKEYWVLGATLMIVGIICPIFNFSFITGAFLGAVVEIVFALVLFKWSKPIS